MKALKPNGSLATQVDEMRPRVSTRRFVRLEPLQ
jgi:hypothetical protein